MKPDRVFSGAFGIYVLEGQPLFEGGNANLFAIKDRPDLLGKVFHAPLGNDHVTRVTELVTVGIENKRRNGISASARRIAWPLDLSVVAGSVTGVIIPRAGPAYFRQTPNRLLAQNFGYLAGGRQIPSIRQRLFVVRQLARALEVLERQDLVHGDVSSTNILFALEPDPELLLIDCDGIHPRGFLTEPYYTNFWKDPRLAADLIPRHDAQSDWYALALAVYRVIVVNARATPDARDFDWMRSELPSSISEHLIQVFDEPHNGAARVPPSEWTSTLTKVIKDEAECERLAELSHDRPANVAGRRSAANRLRSSGAPPPRVPRAPRPAADPPRQRPASKRAHRPGGRPRKAPRRTRQGQPWRKRTLLGAPLAIFALLAFYHYTGVPNWAILNEVNDLLLNAEQRQLIAKLPSQIWDCRDDGLQPPGATATVRCRWDGRELVAIQFSSASKMRAFYDKRATIARRAMNDHARPASCPAGGRWHEGSRGLGDATSFVYAGGARVDWSRTTSLIYRIGLAPAGELAALCRWWRERSAS